MSWGAPNAILELSEKLLYDASYQTPFFNDYDWYVAFYYIETKRTCYVVNK